MLQLSANGHLSSYHLSCTIDIKKLFLARSSWELTVKWIIKLAMGKDQVTSETEVR